jgi:hypothetical protein
MNIGPLRFKECLDQGKVAIITRNVEKVATICKKILATYETRIFNYPSIFLAPY